MEELQEYAVVKECIKKIVSAHSYLVEQPDPTFDFTLPRVIPNPVFDFRASFRKSVIKDPVFELEEEK